MSKLTPKQFNKRVEEFFRTYQDRGMVKWSGFFLSDHTMKINKDKARRAVVYHKEKEMTSEEISIILLKAFSDHYPVSIQLKELDENGNLQPYIQGFVEGYNAKNQIIVSGNLINLNEINYISLKK